MSSPAPHRGENVEGRSAIVEDLVQRFGTWDYVVFVGTLSISALIGIYYGCSGRKQQQTTTEFLLGGRSLSVVPVSLSILASFMSAVTILGTATEMYSYGTQYMVIMLSYFCVIPSAAYLYMPVFYRLNLTSAYEYLELRFSKICRTLATTLFVIQMMVYMAIVVYAPSLAVSQVTGIGVWTSVLSIGVVCTFYTSVGGIKAVVWTDVFQIGLMYASIVAVVWKGASDAGGLDSVLKMAAAHDRVAFFNFNMDPTDRHTVWGLIIGCNFTWLAVYGVSQAMVQRYLTLPTEGKARTAIWINLPGLILLLFICALSGLVLFARYHDCDPLRSNRISANDQLLPLFVMDTLGSYPGLPGLFVSGLFSGALSTLSSGVNSLATVTLEDIIKGYRTHPLSDKAATLITKALAVFYGVLALLLVYVAQQLGNVLQAALAVFGMLGGPLLGIFTLGIFIPQANKHGGLYGLLVSLAITLWIGSGSFIYRKQATQAPISVENCPPYLNVTLRQLGSSAANPEIMWLYRISYVWYSMVATLLVVIVGSVVSAITGGLAPQEVDPRLISPLYNWLIDKLVPFKDYRNRLLVRRVSKGDEKLHLQQAAVPVSAGYDQSRCLPGATNGALNLAFDSSPEARLQSTIDIHSSSRGIQDLSQAATRNRVSSRM